MPCATHCNTLQHTATHCNTLQHTAIRWKHEYTFHVFVALHIHVCELHLQHTAPHCNALQHPTTNLQHLQHEHTFDIFVTKHIHVCKWTHNLFQQKQKMPHQLRASSLAKNTHKYRTRFISFCLSLSLTLSLTPLFFLSFYLTLSTSLSLSLSLTHKRFVSLSLSLSLVLWSLSPILFSLFLSFSPSVSLLLARSIDLYFSNTCEMIYSYMWHDVFIHVTWRTPIDRYFSIDRFLLQKYPLWKGPWQ